MEVFIISVYCDPCTENNLRVNNVYRYLKQDKSITFVKVITSAFKHRNKSYHEQSAAKLNTHFINTPSYNSNISFRRIYNHWVFAFRLYKYLKNLEKQPDIFYCTVPTASAVLACILARQKSKIAIDIIDIWPESFYAIKKSKKKILQILLYPWKLLSTYIYSKADLIFAESIAYSQVAKVYNSKAMVKPYYLGTNHKEYLSLLEKSTVNIHKNPNELVICYGGNIGNSYDFKTLLDAYKKANNINLRLIFVGDGVRKNEVEEYASVNKINATFTGYVKYPDFLKYLSQADIAVNCFKKNTAVVHSYKFNDYVVSGSVILNSLEGETAEMIDSYNIGLNYTDVDSLSFALDKLEKNRALVAEMKRNATIVAKEVLACDKIYPEMVKDMQLLSSDNQNTSNNIESSSHLSKVETNG